jgi:transcriptional regulator with XRE-family HTH domain
MSQTIALIETLKTCLKTNGITYSDIATELNLSESSVKRLFSTRDFSLNRLESICKLMNMEIGEVFQLMNEQQFELQQLTLQQEQEITEDLSLLLVTVCVLNKWSLD